MRKSQKQRVSVPQVDKSHYTFNFYSSERRFVSYYHQVNHILHFVEAGARKILIVGKGDGVVAKILEAYDALEKYGLTIHSFDIAEDLFPDYLGDLVEIDTIVKEPYDVIVCCQALEHIPLHEALDALTKMRTIAQNFVISVPYKAITVRGCIKFPLIQELEFVIKIPIIKASGEMVDDRHYWELGASISVREFKQQLETIGFDILKAYTLKKHGFIYFLVLQRATI